MESGRHADGTRDLMPVRSVEVDGFTWNIHDEGVGPAVVMCHGFPGLGYSYRHQVKTLAAAGYRAVAPDMPGYGRTDRPTIVGEYTNVAVADRLRRLLDALGIHQAVFVGHDFGAPVAWTMALRHADRVAGLVLLAVPYAPDRLPARPTELYAAMARKHFLHLHYFQQPGVAEAELDPRAAEFLQRVFFALSGGYRYLDIWNHPSEGRGYLDVLPVAPELPWDWLSAAELEHYANEFSRTGFGGGLSWYRAYDANWEHPRATRVRTSTYRHCSSRAHPTPSSRCPGRTRSSGCGRPFPICGDSICSTMPVISYKWSVDARSTTCCSTS